MLKFWKKKSPPPRDSAKSQANTQADTQADTHAETAVDRQAAPAAVVEVFADESAVPVAASAVGASLNDDTASTSAPRGWRARLGDSGMARGMGALFARNPQLDESLLDELETTLISADVGVDTSTELVSGLRRRVHKREFADAAGLRMALRAELLAMVYPVAVPLDVSNANPFVILVVGVNGVGKTTTIGKLARRLRDQGREVLLAAGDTFRAAAVEQIKAWGERNDVAVLAQGQGADSASVIFDALQTARARGADVLIADTAGRLHTQDGLMGELGKIGRVLKKIDASAPHEVLMVIDGSTGQNAISQVRQFRQVVGVSGLVVTKLDGSAKGGVVFALAREFGLPIRYLGLGEGAADLRVFDPQAFVDGLLPATGAEP